MANPEHLEILKQGVEYWKEWTEEDPYLQADLSRADLVGAKLEKAILYRANLYGANLGEAILHGADLRGAILRGTILRGADLREANLYAADLSDSDLRSANLTSADLRKAKLIWEGTWRLVEGHAIAIVENLRGADFSRATFGGNVLAAVDLSVARGLEFVGHRGPSTVGIDTIYKSGGKIPKEFLRGCGLSDWEIESTQLYDPNVSAAEATDIAHRVVNLRGSQPFQFYSCFISYSTKDQEFADRLYADLQAKGVRCWFAPHDIQGGRTIHEQIDEAIRRYDRLLLILSEDSIHSGWVETEIANAWERQIQQEKHVLFPVRLVSFEELEKWKCPDPKTGKDLGREIRKYFIPDFSNWKEHDPYQEAFQRLVKDLKAGDSG